MGVFPKSAGQYHDSLLCEGGLESLGSHADNPLEGELLFGVGVFCEPDEAKGPFCEELFLGNFASVDVVLLGRLGVVLESRSQYLGYYA